MNYLSAKEISKTLKQLKSNSSLFMEGITNPNYQIYGMAPHWHPHQAVCLLAGLKTIDADTFSVLLHLSPLQLGINEALQSGNQLRSVDILGDREGFADFILYCFPIPHDKIIFLRNLFKLLQSAIDAGDEPFEKIKASDKSRRLLDPEKTLLWAKSKKLNIPTLLEKSIKQRSSVSLLELEDTFPDEISFIACYNSHRILQNQKKPVSICTIPNLQLGQEPWKQEQNITAGEQDNTSPWANIFPEELQQDPFTLLQHMASPRGDILSNEGVIKLKRELERKGPCPKTLFQKTVWTAEEAALAYYNIDPQIFEHKNVTYDYSIFLMRRIIILLDKQEKVYDNYRNHLQAIQKAIEPGQRPLVEFYSFLKEKGYSTPSHFPPSKDKNVVQRNLSINDANDRNASECKEYAKLSERGKKLLSQVMIERKIALDQALRAKHLNDKSRVADFELIMKYGAPPTQEFEKYTNQGPTPPTLEISHRCRAIAKLLQHYEPHLDIARLRAHQLMNKFGHLGRNIDNRTFQSWMHLEGIYDRDRSKNA